ncbi:MAG: SDR family NAD(P)-dependent oxidoreductase [Pedobacter sp.]|nr:MAG: SDR family NAD(P)-dependent oxidoreductase [Pedobacter sp.]
MEIKKISILGCGWYGLPLAKALVNDGFKVKGSNTSTGKLSQLSEAGIEPFLINAEQSDIVEDFFDCDILIISVPPKVNSGQLPYPDKIRSISAAAQNAGVKQIIMISSTGIYQDGNFVVDEHIIPQPNTPVGRELREAENILKENGFFTTTIIRFAGLIGPERNLAKHFAGKKDIVNGLAPINLIHLDDCIGLTNAIIHQKAFGRTYHGVTPDHPTRKDFYTKACITSGFDKPSFKEELLDWKQVESKNVARFLAYKYVYENWQLYFDKILGI